jgi:hypothetical protein
MALVPPEAFGAALRELPNEAFTGFVADLYRGRGRDVRVEYGDRDVVVIVDGGDTRRLLVHRPRGLLRRLPDPADAGVDGVVTDAIASRWDPGGADDEDTVGPDRLHELALFGIDPSDRAELFGELAVSPSTPGSAPVSGRPRSEVAPVRRSHLVVAVAALALIAVAVVGLPGDTEGSIDASASESLDDRVTAFSPQGTVADSGDGDGPDGPAAANDANGSVAGSSHPTGIDENGFSSGRFIARNHGRLLRGEPFRLVITRQEFAGDNRSGYRRETLYVAEPGRAYSTLEENGTFRGRTFITDSTAFYVNGSVGIVRTDGTVRRVSVPEEQSWTIPGYTARALSLLLPENSSQGVETRSHNGTTLHRLPFSIDRSFGQRNVTGYAVVDDDGLVRDLQRRWELPDRNLSVTIRFRTVPGNVTITRPDWIERNATADARLGAVADRPRPGGPDGPDRPRRIAPVRTAPGNDQPGLRTTGR